MMMSQKIVRRKKIEKGLDYMINLNQNSKLECYMKIRSFEPQQEEVIEIQIQIEMMDDILSRINKIDSVFLAMLFSSKVFVKYGGNHKKTF
jgi:hypothetical protein